jgi:surface carbohydrate biosynthesis protein
MLNRIIYLPLEIKSREFSSKLLLAAELCARGIPVVIGQQWMIYNNLDRLPPGVILFKSFNKIHLNAMRTAKQRGFYVASQEEE